MNTPFTNNQQPGAEHASLGLLLAAAVEELFPQRTLFIEHSFIGGYYCHFDSDDPAAPDDLHALTRRISEYCQGDAPLELIQVEKKELLKRFKDQGRDDKLEILKHLGTDLIPAARFRHYLDYRIEPMTSNLSRLKQFSIDPYDDGFLLRFPNLLPPHSIPHLKDSPKLYQVIQQREEWGRALKVSNLCQLNHRLKGDLSRELVQVAEGLHEKTIAQIADDLCASHPTRRVVFISGPSSSGKTTFAKRLAVQLKVNLYDTLALSMDDYFLDHRDMQLRSDGKPDFESVAAIDIPRLVGTIRQLLAGETVPRRHFVFKEGIGRDGEEILHLGPEAYLIIEGIHGLNPIFPGELGSDTVQRIYVSAITQLNVDNEHRVSSSDNRLIRRLVRDTLFRGYSVEATLLRWPEVRLGEERNIFTYQEEADLMFNSSLLYELAVLRTPAEQVLQAIPATSSVYPEAQRLLTFLSLIAPIKDQNVPGNSILREFIGGSKFEY